MNQETKLIKTILGSLNLAEHLSNVSNACKLMDRARIAFTGYLVQYIYVLCVMPLDTL